jgi:hypothetical protein
MGVLQWYQGWAKNDNKIDCNHITNAHHIFDFLFKLILLEIRLKVIIKVSQKYKYIRSSEALKLEEEKKMKEINVYKLKTYINSLIMQTLEELKKKAIEVVYYLKGSCFSLSNWKNICIIPACLPDTQTNRKQPTK